MTNVQPHQRPTFQWRESILLAVVLIVGSTLTLLAGRSHQQHEALLVKEKQTTATNLVVDAFELELTRTKEAVRDAGLMIESNPNLTRDQFNRYMQKLLASQLSVNLVEWQPIVPAGALAQFEAAARKEGSSNYRVVQPDASSKGWEPVSGRDTYVPVRFAWPADYQTEGLDMSFSPERMASKLASQRSRMPVASGIFPFMKSGMVDSGVKAVAISTTVFDTNDSARSYVAAVVDLPTLFQRAAQVADSVQVDLLVYPSGANSAQPFYTWFGEGSDLKQGQVDLGLATAGDPAATVTFGEQVWRVVLHPRTGFYAALSPAHSHLIYASGFGLTLLMLVMLALHLRTNFRLQERSADLFRSHQSLKDAQRIAKVGNWELDIASNHIRWSDELYVMQGLDPTKPPPDYTESAKLFTPESWERLSTAIARASESGVSYELELEMIRPDGSHGWMLAHGEAVQDTDGSIVGVRGTATDITERKLAQIASEVALSQLQATLEALPDLLFEVDAEGRILSYHTHRSDLLAAPPEVFMGKRIADVLPPEAASVCQRAIDEAAQNGSSYGETIRLALAQGERWFELSVAPMHTAAKSDQRFIMISRDITERKLAAEALQETQAMLTRTEEIGNLGGWEFDIATLQQTWTRAIYAIHEIDSTGYPTVEQGINFYTPESRPIIEQAVQRAIEHGEPFDLELEIITAKGNFRAVHTIGRHDPVRGKIVGFFQDITERKQAVDAMRQSEARYRAVSESANDAILTVDEAGLIVGWNCAATDIFGYAKADALCMPMVRLMPERYRDRHLAGMSRMLAGAVPNAIGKTLEVHGLRRDGSEFPLELSLAQWENADGHFFTGMIRDITERKQAEQALAKQFDELRRWQQVTLNRESRILSAKKEINDLLAEHGQPPRYPSALDEGAQE